MGIGASIPDSKAFGPWGWPLTCLEPRSRNSGSIPPVTPNGLHTDSSTIEIIRLITGVSSNKGSRLRSVLTIMHLQFYMNPELLLMFIFTSFKMTFVLVYWSQSNILCIRIKCAEFYVPVPPYEILYAILRQRRKRKFWPENQTEYIHAVLSRLWQLPPSWELKRLGLCRRKQEVPPKYCYQ